MFRREHMNRTNRRHATLSACTQQTLQALTEHMEATIPEHRHRYFATKTAQNLLGVLATGWMESERPCGNSDERRTIARLREIVEQHIDEVAEDQTESLYIIGEVAQRLLHEARKPYYGAVYNHADQ
jgi:hypothetical protein